VLSVAAAEDAAGEPRQLLAPGHDVLTLAPGGHWDFASGSSIAAAEVTATAALILSQRPHMSAPELYRLLARSSQSLHIHAVPFVSVNACAALADVLQRAGCPAERAAVAAADSTAAHARAPAPVNAGN